MAEDSTPRPTLVSLLLGALGVVYGDLGTSPLYAVRTAAQAMHGALSRPLALGILSLIVWTLIIILGVKYCLLVLRADNQGEGGTLALMSLIKPGKRRRWWLAVLGLVGAALLYGDGIITPAISVLSALEGLQTAAPGIQSLILPAALAILLALFLVQGFGTGTIGLAFGPIMLVWFAVLAVLGITNIARHPGVLAGLNPIYAVALLKELNWRAGPVLGGVFLCVTGGEALYADIGHFGRRPIRLNWFGLVLPALVLNYAGQVGELMDSGRSPVVNPFFEMAPRWSVYPLVILATLATIIASQAIISGVFSLTRQAMHLGWFPGVTVRQTSETRYGQVYVPLVNWLMMLGTLALTLGFRSSDRLSGAYGLAVSGTMLITTILMASCMRRIWNWSWMIVAPVSGLFLIIDLIYFAANLTKLTKGGWIPLSIAALLFYVLTVWHAGLDAVHRRMRGDSCEKCLARLRNKKIPRVPGTAIFLTRQRHAVPALLSQHMQHMGALQENVLALTIQSIDRPRATDKERAKVKDLGQGLWRVTLRYGFMETRALRTVLKEISELSHIDFDDVVWFGARDLVVRDRLRPRLGRVGLAIFRFLFRNSVRTVDHFAIPAENFVEVAREIRV